MASIVNEYVCICNAAFRILLMDGIARYVKAINIVKRDITDIVNCPSNE